MFRLFSLLLIAFISGCATQMTPDDYTNIKKVAVMNSIKDELFIYNRGLTVFGNSVSNANIAEWGLSEYQYNKAIENVSKKHPAIQFTKIETTPIADRVELFKKLQNDGYDTFLEIGNAGIYTPAGGGSYILPPEAGGFIIFSTSFMGKNIRNLLCPQIGYTLIRLSDSKFLGYSTNSSTFPTEPTKIEVKPFSEYSPEEKELIKNEFIKNINYASEKLADALVKIKNQQKNK